ncbi:glutathione S-transferase [Mycena polygramma]|nr:glutathione S-transferase [Mycena polygramma]
MVFKLYSRPVVPVAGSVLVAMLAAERNIPLEYIPIDMAGGEHRTPEYREKFHPFGQVPVIDEEGFILCETRAICAVLDVYEVILGKHKYLAGDEFTLVDLFHLYIAPVFAGVGIDVMTNKGPDSNVTRWWNDIISRPSWVKLQAEGIKTMAL